MGPFLAAAHSLAAQQILLPHGAGRRVPNRPFLFGGKQRRRASKYLRPDIFRALPPVSTPRVKAPAPRRRKRGGRLRSF
jgi:hypothetical protein